MELTTGRIYLDSCLVIYLVEQHATFFPQVKNAIEKLSDSEYCISPLVEMECLIGPLKLHNARLVDEYGAFLSRMTILEMPREVYQAAAQLRSIHNIKTPDALHLATALHHHCDQVWTNDDRLVKASAGIARNVLRS